MDPLLVFDLDGAAGALGLKPARVRWLLEHQKLRQTGTAQNGEPRFTVEDLAHFLRVRRHYGLAPPDKTGERA